MAKHQPVIWIGTVISESDLETVWALPHFAEYEFVLWVLAPSGADVCSKRIEQGRSTGGHGRPELAGELVESALSAASAVVLQYDYTLLVSTNELRNQPIAALRSLQPPQASPPTPESGPTP